MKTFFGSCLGVVAGFVLVIALCGGIGFVFLQAAKEAIPAAMEDNAVADQEDAARMARGQRRMSFQERMDFLEQVRAQRETRRR